VSRLNTNTGRLTEAMFVAVVEALLGLVGGAPLGAAALDRAGRGS
jgi:hypothetical protein